MGELAEKWSWQDNFRNLVFFLRKDVKWHDGKPFTSKDVKFTFDMLREAPEAQAKLRINPRKDWYANIEGIEAVDPHTVVFRLKRPQPSLLIMFASGYTPIYAAHVPPASYRTGCVGTGPFKVKEWRKGEFVDYVKNTDYFVKGRPYLDAINFYMIKDRGTRFAAFRTKKLDSGFQVSNAQWVKDLRQQEAGLISADTGFAAWAKAAFIVDQPPYSDFKLRKAIHLASDRSQMVDALWQGYGRPQGPVSWVLKRWALPEEELLKLPGYRVGTQEREEDEREARQLYEAAGSPSLFITFADQPSYVPQFAPQYKRKLEQVLGAKVDYQVRSYAIINEGVLRGTMPFTWAYDNGWIDLDDWVYPYFRSGSSANVFRLSDPQLDSLLDAEREAFDLEERQQLGYQIQRYLLENVLAWVDFASYFMLWVAWPYYKNFRPASFFGDSFHMANAWLDRSDPVWGSRA